MPPDPALPPPPPPRAFDPRLSRVLLGLWAASIALLFVTDLLSEPVEQLERPEAYATRLAEAEVVVAEALRDAILEADEPSDGARDFARKLLDMRDELLPVQAERLLGAAARLDALADRPDESGEPEGARALEVADDERREAARGLRARAGVMLGETGRRDLADVLAPGAGEPDALVEAVLAAYGERPPTRADLEAAARLAGSWSGDLLAYRLATALDDEAAADAAIASLEERREARLANASGVAAWLLPLAIAGFVASLVLIVLPRRLLGLAEVARPFPPLPFEDGLGLWVRYALGFLLLGQSLALLGVPLGATTLVASAPLVVLLLLRVAPVLSRPARVLVGVGLPGPDRARALGLVLLAGSGLWAFVVAGLVLVRLTAMGVFGEPDWIEPTFEPLLLGPPAARWGLALEAVVWAPLFEELAFRGVLFAALRRRLPFLPAAVLSSGVWSAMHLYDASGFLGLLWIGLALCYAYERTRNLWIPVIAHALHNGTVLGFLLALYG